MRPKKELQSKNSSSRPEPSRPITAPAPTTPTQTPTAWARSSGGKDVVMIDSVVGITSAAPTPIAARSPISVSARRRRSPRAAAHAEDHETGEQDALAAEAVADGARDQQQAGEDHRVGVDDPCSSLCVAPVSRARSGSATFRPLTAETTIMRARRDDPEDQSATAGREWWWLLVRSVGAPR